MSLTTTTPTTSNGYITLPITVDPNQLIQQAIAAIQAELPGWIPVEGHIEMILLEQFAAMAAQAANVAASASEAIFEYYGNQLIGIPPITGSPASALTTWTFVNDLGYTVPAGVVVGYQRSATDIVLFSTTEPFSTAAASPSRVIANAQVAVGSTEIIDPNGSFTSADVNKSVSDGGVAIPETTTPVGVTTVGVGTGGGGTTLPQPVMTVADTSSFPSSGTFYVQDSNGYEQVSYTGTSPTTFTGCTTSGTGTLSTGGNIFQILQMPQATINVVSTSGFGSSGSVVIYTNVGTAAVPVYQPQFVSYTGSSGTQLTGCTGGVGLLWDNQNVNPYIESIQTVSEATLSVPATANESAEAVTLGQIVGTQVATNIPIQSQSVGAVNNNLATGTLTLVNPALAYVTSIASTTVSSGGSDAETVSQYINRLSQELQLLTPRPILPSDYAILAESVSGVTRAAAYNNTYAGDTFPSNLTSGNSTLTAGPATTTAAESDGQSLPQTVIHVASTTNFPPAGSLYVVTSTGGSLVTYTGITGTAFTGCVGGTGVMALGNLISGSLFNFSTFDVGLNLSGAGITPGTTIQSYLNPVQVTMSLPAGSSETYSPVSIDSTNNVERAVAVSAIDASGQPVGSSVAAAVETKLSSLREVNFVVSYLAPSYQSIYVTYVVISEPNANPTTVENAVNAAVTNFLSPATWAGGDQIPPVWDTSIEFVYYLSLAAVIENVPGVQSIQVVGGVPSLGLGTGINPAYGYHDVSLVASIGVSLPNLISVSGTALPGL